MKTLKIEQLETMGKVEEKTFWTAFENVLANDDGAAAKGHLTAGRPIYYCEDRFPDAMVREWPDGRRELVSFGETGVVAVMGEVPTEFGKNSTLGRCANEPLCTNSAFVQSAGIKHCTKLLRLRWQRQ